MRSYEPVNGEISLRSGGISPSRAGLLPYECNFKNISKLYVRQDPVKSGPARQSALARLIGTAPKLFKIDHHTTVVIAERYYFFVLTLFYRSGKNLKARTSQVGIDSTT